MSTLLSPRRPLASLSLNAAPSPAKQLEVQKRTPSQKPAAAKNEEKHGEKAAAFPKPTLLAFEEENPEAAFSDTSSLDPPLKTDASEGVIEPTSELESVLKSLSILAGAPSSAVADLTNRLAEVAGRRVVLSSSVGCCLMARAVRLAVSEGSPPKVCDGLLRLVTRLALEGGESTDQDEGGGDSSCIDGVPKAASSLDNAAGALCEAGVAAAVALHLRPVPAKDGRGGALAARSAGAATEALAAIALGPTGAAAVVCTPGLLAAVASLLEGGSSNAAMPSAAAAAASALGFLATLAFHEPAAVADSAVLAAACSWLAARPFEVDDGLALFRALADGGALGAAAANGAVASDGAVGAPTATCGARSEAAAAEEVACCVAEWLRAWAAAPAAAAAAGETARHAAPAATALLARLGYRADATVKLFPAAGQGRGVEEAVVVRRKKL